MSRFVSKKRALLTAAVTSLALVAVAIAFYSTVGSGEGGGTTDTAYATDLLITGDVNALEDGTLVPGSSVGISGEIENDNPGAAKVHNLAGTVDAAAGCTDSWFTITGVTIPDADDVIPAGESIPFTATLNMEDAYVDHDNNTTTPEIPVDQNGCKGATLDIDWSSDLGT